MSSFKTSFLPFPRLQNNNTVDTEALLKIRNSSDAESEETFDLHGISSHRSHCIWPSWLHNGCLLFFMTISVLFGFAYFLKDPSMAQCVDKTSIWSPANSVVKYTEFDFDNDFAHKTKYRGPPTPELEKNWEELWWINGVRFPEDKLNLINRTIDLGNGRKPRKAIDGKGGYHVMIDVFHQLHCLNLLRQSTWQSYYRTHSHIVRTPLPFTDSEIGIRMHLDHCIETLRLTLMCHADTTPSLLLQDPESPIGVSTDFSSHRKCRNFWGLRVWTWKNQIVPTEALRWEPDEEGL